MTLEYENLKDYIKKLGFDIDIEAYVQLKEAIEYCLTNSNMHIFWR